MSGGSPHLLHDSQQLAAIPDKRGIALKDKDLTSHRRSLPPSGANSTTANTTTPTTSSTTTSTHPSSRRDARRKSSNRIHVQPASPEVLSSLIDALSSNASSPTDHQFDYNLPNITESHPTPPSPVEWNTSFPRSNSSSHVPLSPLSNGFGNSKDSLVPPVPYSRKSSLRPNSTVESRRSSRVSEHRSSKSKSREVAYEESLDDAYSIGTPSIERGTVAEPSKTPNSRRSIKSLKSARSGRSLRSLAMRNSTESLAKSDIPIVVSKKETEDPKRERLFIRDSVQSTTPWTDHDSDKSDTPMDAFDLLTSSEVPSPRRPSALQRVMIHHDGSKQAGHDHSRKSSYNIPSADFIPSRDSSRRHSANFANRKRRSMRAASENRTSENLQSDNEIAEDDFHTPPQSPPLQATELDNRSVNRRIEELKEQMAERERQSSEEARRSLAVPQQKSRSPSPSPLTSVREPSPAPAKPEERVQSEDEKNLYAAFDDLEEETAPSPAIRVAPQRTDRHTEITISAFYPRDKKLSLDTGRDGSLSPLPSTLSPLNPQRRSSKLHKRTPRPMSPTGSERHRRRFSMASPRPPPSLNEGADSVHDSVEEYLSSPRFSQQVANPQTGRVICFSEVGDPQGSVVFCCVGMGLTRYITTFYDELATTLKLRLITPDRPGVGGSEAYTSDTDTPLLWPDDVRTICEHRGITKFSILAHSAGAIYALATALRMPQHMRCRVHLLAPWIPPSQLTAIGSQQEQEPSATMPYSQRFLRSLPTTFFRAANSNFLGLTSNSLTTSLPRTPKKKRARTTNSPITPIASEGLTNGNSPAVAGENSSPKTETTATNGLDKENRPPLLHTMSSPAQSSNPTPRTRSRSRSPLPPPLRASTEPNTSASTPIPDPLAEKSAHSARLATRTWDLATLNANPSIDLLVCLERRAAIGFMYTDITRAVVIHHGSKDNRVPVENVKWLGKRMRRCEVRVLEGEGHGLMANAGVMTNVLVEMAGEWDGWNKLVGQGGRSPRVG